MSGGAVSAASLWLLPISPERPRPGLREGDRPSNGPAQQWLRPVLFRRPFGPLHREAKQPGFAILR